MLLQNIRIVSLVLLCLSISVCTSNDKSFLTKKGDAQLDYTAPTEAFDDAETPEILGLGLGTHILPRKKRKSMRHSYKSLYQNRRY